MPHRSKAWQFYADRSIYYSTFPIQEQAIRGDWSFELQRVYTIGILNFVFPDKRKADERYHRKIMLMDVKTKEVFSDKLIYIYLELPKFQKEETELETMFDKWMYVLKNLSNLMSRPMSLQERIFERLFEQAEIAKYSREEQYGYEQSIKAYRDLQLSCPEKENRLFPKDRSRGLHFSDRSLIWKLNDPAL